MKYDVCRVHLIKVGYLFPIPKLITTFFILIVDPNTASYEERPYMQRRGGSWEGNDLKKLGMKGRGQGAPQKRLELDNFYDKAKKEGRLDSPSIFGGAPLPWTQKVCYCSLCVRIYVCMDAIVCVLLLTNHTLIILHRPQTNSTTRRADKKKWKPLEQRLV